jgi:hypothetical protein
MAHNRYQALGVRRCRQKSFPASTLLVRANYRWPACRNAHRSCHLTVYGCLAASDAYHNRGASWLRRGTLQTRNFSPERLLPEGPLRALTRMASAALPPVCFPPLASIRPPWSKSAQNSRSRMLRQSSAFCPSSRTERSVEPRRLRCRGETPRAGMAQTALNSFQN